MNDDKITILGGHRPTYRKYLMNAEQRTATTSDEAITEMVHLRDAWRLNVFRTCERLTF